MGNALRSEILFNITESFKNGVNVSEKLPNVSERENQSSVFEELYYNDTLLREISYNRMIFNIPVIVILFCFMIIGFFGNTLVMIIYKFFSPKTPSNFYILLLAVLDMNSCVFCIPFHLYQLWVPYIHANETICQISRFLENFSNLASGFILVSVASERYFKINFPLVPYERSKAKVISFVVQIVAVSLSWPQFYISQEVQVKVGKDQVIGEDCTYGGQSDHRIYVLLFHGVLLFVYILSVVAFSYFYGHIFYFILKRKYLIDNNQSITQSTTEIPKSSSVSSQKSALNASGIKVRASRTTISLLAITVSACLGYTPFVVIMLLRTTGTYFQTTLTPSGEYFHYGSSPAVDLICTLCMKSYFINCAVNPIIYSIVNPRFRKSLYNASRRIRKKTQIVSGM